ncbi:unnamed protein product [Chilo suppressalis]|uniref:PWWP domain-containing protein n=1 Tax=Chilo suppressalis TaxID=168631 RepID=A0ABN8LAH5_CHISP|nr:unnamed protein product [Chilo suppressalis]
MGKKVREYKSGDFIFAKVKGYPAWPARVQKMNGKKYFVYFYGTGETANLPPNMIFDYAENKDKFLTKTVKRRDFNDGVKQIEHDFANNVPLEQVIGAIAEPPAEANDSANDTGNSTMDDTMADTTAADETVDEIAANTTQNENAIEDSDEAGPLVIDEGKKGGKSKADAIKTPAKEAVKAKEPKTPRGKAKKEEAKEEEEAKKEEEIVSRSGRKIRPKRYIDEQTEENTTLPSPVPKKKRAVSPPPAEKDGDKEKEKVEPTKEKPAAKLFNAVTQSELEDLKEPFKPEDSDKDNILITYLPTGLYVGIKLFQSKPSSFKNDAARLAWEKQSASNSITLKQQLERGQITPQSVAAQLVMDLNLTDEEKASLDKERETEEKKSRVQFLKTEMKLIELDAKIKTCLCLEKADTELCLKLLDELNDLDVKPLMLLKHPSCLETVKRMRAYVGNTPSWDLSEQAAIQFSKQAHKIRKQADSLYTHMKTLFTTPEGLSFWEFFSERVLHFKKVTSAMSADELLELVHEPPEMSIPTSHTMKTAIEAANEQEPPTQEEETKEKDKKKSTPVKAKKPSTNSTPSKPSTKRQSSRNKQQEEKDAKKSDAEDKPEETTDKPPENDKEELPIDNKEKESSKEDVASTTNEEVTNTNKEVTNENNVEDKEKEIPEKEIENTSKELDNETGKDNGASEKETVSEEKEKPNDKKERNDKSKEVKQDGESKEDGEKDKDIAEPRAKRSRESKKTEPPPPRSPAKRKSKV